MDLGASRWTSHENSVQLSLEIKYNNKINVSKQKILFYSTKICIHFEIKVIVNRVSFKCKK